MLVRPVGLLQVGSRRGHQCARDQSLLLAAAVPFLSSGPPREDRSAGPAISLPSPSPFDGAGPADLKGGPRLLPSDDVTVTVKRGDLELAAWALGLSSGADQQRIARVFRDAAQEPGQRRGVPGREFAATVFLRGVNPS